MATLSTVVATTKNTMLDAQPENVSNKVMGVTTPNDPWGRPNEKNWLWVKQAMYKNCLEGEKLAGKRHMTKFLLQKV